MQALRPAHCPGHARWQRGGETADSSPSPLLLLAGSECRLSNPAQPCPREGSSLLADQATSWLMLSIRGCILSAETLLFLPSCRSPAWAFFRSVPGLRGCLGHLCPGTPVPFQTGILTTFRQCFRWRWPCA